MPLRFDEGERDRHRSRPFPIGGNRDLVLLTSGPREALILERTPVACGTGRRAYRRAEFHDGLVERAGGVARDEGGGELNDPAVDDQACDVLADSEQPREDPKHIPIDGRGSDAERDARDRSRGVRANSREGGQCLVGGWHLPSMFHHDDPCRGMETLRPAVEPESLPYREHVVEARCRQILDGGEPHEESFVIGRAACDPRPLKEIFGDEDPVGILCPAPGEITPIRGIPSEQPAPDLRRRGGAHWAHDARRPTSEIREPWWRSPEAPHINLKQG